MLHLNFKFTSTDLKAPDRFEWWRISSFVLQGIMVASVILSIYFIYGNVYRTLEDAHTIIALNLNMPADVVNADNYDKAQALVSKKLTILTIPKNLRNIFAFGISTSTNLTGSTTTQTILKQ